MAQLLIVVMSIVLMGIVVAGGVNYINPDVGVRTDTIRKVSLSRNSIEGAFFAYRIANRGAIPPSGESLESSLNGYLSVPLENNTPHGMAWRISNHASKNYLCLYSKENAPDTENMTSEDGGNPQKVSKAVMVAVSTFVSNDVQHANDCVPLPGQNHELNEPDDDTVVFSILFPL